MNKGVQIGKEINVTITTVKVIKALESTLAKLESDFASQGAKIKKHEQELEKWEKEVLAICISNVKKAKAIELHYRHNSQSYVVEFEVPVKQSLIPTRPVKGYEGMYDSEYKEQVKELENALRILKMTEDTVVSASTYSAISRYL